MDQGVEIKKSTDGKIHIDFNRRSFEELTVVETESTFKDYGNFNLDSKIYSWVVFLL